MRRASLALILLALAAAGCGDDDRPAPPPPLATAASIEATASGPDDLVVATVNGKPVWGSCVATQARALGVDRAAALDQCVAFELMAQEADARGLRADPDVVAAWRRELVRTLILADLGPIDTFEELPDELRRAVEKRIGLAIDLPALRGGHWVRADVPAAKAGTPEDELARQIAQATYDELKDDPGVLPDELFDALKRHTDRLAPGHKVSRSNAPYLTPVDDNNAVRPAVEAFRLGLWGIPAIGRISPPVRTKWGYDVILYWEDSPAMDMRPKAFASVRTQLFAWWARKIGASLGVQVTIDEDRLAQLAGEAAGPDEAPRERGAPAAGNGPGGGEGGQP